MTGLSVQSGELHPKRLSLLKEALPHLSNVGVLGETDVASTTTALVEPARQLGLKLLPAGAGNADDFDAAFETMARGGAEAVLNVGGSLFFQHRRQVADLALRHRWAMIVAATEAADAGALLSYGADLKENVKRLARLVDRILRGANPATIPVEQVNVFELVVNRRTARALGIELPRTLMLRATRVIE